MYSLNTLLTTTAIATLCQVDKTQVLELYKDKAAAEFCPEQAISGASRKGTPLQAAMMMKYFALRRFGVAGPLASKITRQLMHSVVAHPDAPQHTLMVLMNGSLSIMPTADVDLSTGYLSGGYLAFAIVIDVRNIFERIEQALSAEPRVVGEAD